MLTERILAEMRELQTALLESPEQFTDGELSDFTDLGRTIEKLATKRFVDRLIERTNKD